MSSGDRVPLDEAREIAQRLRIELFPTCHRIEIAGSIRRERDDIGDIDLVCEPIMADILDLFEGATGERRDFLHERCNDMLAEGALGQRLDKNGRPTWGHSLKRATFGGLNVDIQAVTDPDSWGAWLLIRTGPADFNKRLVTQRGKGGALPPGFEFRDGFKLYRAGGRVPTPTEEDVFAAMGLPFIAPKDRR